ncbi:hypothetical protein ACFL2E_11220 [Thermodesulfobacteriota bacterium]
MNNIIEELKGLFRQSGIPVFGIAESKLLESEPEGNRPSDMLSSPLSMLCFGLPVPKGILLDQKRLNKNYWRMASVYYHNIDVISSQVAVIIEGQNEIATPVLS